MMVKQKLFSKQLKNRTNSKNQIRWIASMNGVKASGEQHFEGEIYLPKKRRAVLQQIAERAFCFYW